MSYRVRSPSFEDLKPIREILNRQQRNLPNDLLAIKVVENQRGKIAGLAALSLLVEASFFAASDDRLEIVKALKAFIKEGMEIVRQSKTSGMFVVTDDEVYAGHLERLGFKRSGIALYMETDSGKQASKEDKPAA